MRKMSLQMPIPSSFWARAQKCQMRILASFCARDHKHAQNESADTYSGQVLGQRPQMLNMKLEACSGQVLGQMPKIAKVQTGLASNGPGKE